MSYFLLQLWRRLRCCCIYCGGERVVDWSIERAFCWDCGKEQP